MAFYEDSFDVRPRVNETLYNKLLRGGASESVAREMARDKGQFLNLDTIRPLEERDYAQH
jgi:hypothetical protein